MLKNILPDNVYLPLAERVGFNAINEIRLRADKPIVISEGSNRYFLSEKGLSGNIKEAILSSKVMIEDIIFRASECSIYSVNEQIKKGFLVMNNAVRIGIGGDLIEENGIIKTMTNFNSLNIRIPHEIRNCSLSAFGHILEENKLLNTLVISPPGAGKTTFLRDFIWQLSERNFAYNVLVLDERGELDYGRGLGNFYDKICFASKAIGFENGIRALSPNLIVTDELGGEKDIEAVRYAANCGVNILASVHSDSIESFTKKPCYATLISEKLFKRYVLLSLRKGPGTLEGIYNENFARITKY